MPEAIDTSLRVVTCVSLDCSGTPTISVVEGTGCAGGCDLRSDVARPPSLTFAPNGRPVVAYQQQYLFNQAGGTIGFGRIKLVTCGNTTCTAGNVHSVLHHHNGYSPVVHVRPDGTPFVAFLGGSVPEVLTVGCRTPTCAGPTANSTVSGITVDGGMRCAPGCNPMTFDGFYLSMVVRPDGLPMLALQDENSGSLKLIDCGGVECQRDNAYGQVDGIPGCGSGCLPSSFTGRFPALAMSSTGRLVVAYRDETTEAIRLAAQT
jgi:hypothetical protein